MNGIGIENETSIGEVSIAMSVVMSTKALVKKRLTFKDNESAHLKDLRPGTTERGSRRWSNALPEESLGSSG
jgi:hypothetical protein